MVVVFHYEVRYGKRSILIGNWFSIKGRQQKDNVVK